MTLHLKLPSQNNNLSPRILVIGIGGTGGNIINSMINSGIEGVDFLNVNTDSQQLKHSKVEKTLQLGPSCTQGLGAGGDPEMGKKAAEEVLEEIGFKEVKKVSLMEGSDKDLLVDNPSHEWQSLYCEAVK